MVIHKNDDSVIWLSQTNALLGRCEDAITIGNHKTPEWQINSVVHCPQLSTAKEMMFSSPILSHIICFVPLCSKTCKKSFVWNHKTCLECLECKSLGKGSQKDEQPSKWTITTREGGKCWTDLSIWSVPAFPQKKNPSFHVISHLKATL